MDEIMGGELGDDGQSASFWTGLRAIYKHCEGTLALSAVRLTQPVEQLQVHMDCLDALGEIVSIEDVDDMGGAVQHTR